MTNYHKIFIYSRDFQLKEMTLYNIDSKGYIFDYFTLQKNSIVLPKIANVSKNDYIYSGAIQGIVSSVGYSDGQTEIVYMPLLSLFDVDFYYNRNTKSGSLLDFLSGMIKSAFVECEAKQKIPYLSVTKDTAGGDVTNAPLGIVDNVNNIHDILKKAMQKCNLYCDISLHPNEAQNKIQCVLKINNSNVTIKAQKPYIVDCELDIQPFLCGINKFVAIRDEHETETKTYYRHQLLNYPEPSYYNVRYAYVSGEDNAEFITNAKERAYEEFDYDDSDNNIIISIADGSIYDGLTIGTKSVIKYEGFEYNSVLTAIEHQNGIKTYTFGTVRLTLTDKLKLMSNY